MISKQKYKHIYGVENPKSHIFYNLQPSINNNENQNIACSDKFFAIPYTGGGGPVYVSPIDKFGKVEPECPVVNGHKGAVIDIAFSPFNSSIMCTASVDCTIKLWNIDETNHSFSENDSFFTSIHSHSLRCIAFSPTVNNMIVTCSQDQVTRLFDIERKEGISTINTEAICNNISFNYDGTVLVHACKNKSLRLMDLRAPMISLKTNDDARLGANVRAAWCSRSQNVDVILTTCSISGQRFCQCWDPRKLGTEPICSKIIDSESGSLFPMYDESSSICYIAGKGDSIIRIFELNFLEDQSKQLDHISCEKANEFKSDNTQPIAGICLMPKTLVSVRDVEITKMLKMTQNSVVPITYILPRQRKEFFQDDVYSPIKATLPSIDISQFISSSPGSNVNVKTLNLKPEDMINLSEKPEEVKIAKTVEFKATIDKNEEESRQRESIFAKLSQMAIERQAYHPNLSGGSCNLGIPAKVDAKIISDNEVEEDEWDD